MAKKIPARQQSHKKKENKFIDMPKDQLIKVCVIVAIVIIAIVLFFVLRDRFDGHLQTADGLPVTQSDDWVIANTGTTSSPRYYKIAEAGDVEGYAREYNAETRMQIYTPQDPALNITSAQVMAANGEYDQLSANVSNNLASYMPGAVIGEMDESDVNGFNARSFSYSYSYPQSDSETGAETGLTNYTVGYYIYIKAGRGQSVLTYVSSSATDEASLATVDTLKAEALKLASTVKVGE